MRTVFKELKKLLFVPVAILSVFSLSAQSPKGFLVKGSLENEGNGTIMFYYRNPTNSSEIIRDSIVCQNGSLEFRGIIPNNDPIIMVMQRMQEGHPVPVPPGRFFVQNGDIITVKGDAASTDMALFTGNKYNVQFNQLKEIEKDDKQAIMNAYHEMAENNDAGQEDKDQLESLKKDLAAKQKAFVAAHPDWLASAMLVCLDLSQAYTPSEMEETFEGFTSEVKQSQYGRLLQERFATQKKTGVGASAIPFTKKDINGKTVNLSDYKGKYVLLDFWGSWCGPCRAGNPHLKELYAKYKDKGFTIIGIANEQGATLAESMASWKKAVQEDKLPWTQVLNNEGLEKFDVRNLYDVSAFPTKILLDKDGKIIGRFTGTASSPGVTDDLTEKLKEVMGG